MAKKLNLAKNYQISFICPNFVFLPKFLNQKLSEDLDFRLVSTESLIEILSSCC